MKRFLSIDWDFFIEATATQRALMFPDGGNENLNTSLRDYIWDTCYRHPDLVNIEVSPYYKTLLKICRDFRGECYIADSHRFSYDFIMGNTSPNEEFEVYNIDFHHDLYHYRTNGERVNCGNWGTILREDRPNMKYVWVKCEDSDTMTIGDVEVDAEMISMEQFLSRFRKSILVDFDYLYLCRSAVWSPPHLDPKFIKVVKLLMHNCSTIHEIGIDKPRLYEIPAGDFNALIHLANEARAIKEEHSKP